MGYKNNRQNAKKNRKQNRYRIENKIDIELENRIEDRIKDRIEYESVNRIGCRRMQKRKKTGQEKNRRIEYKSNKNKIGYRIKSIENKIEEEQKIEQKSTE